MGQDVTFDIIARDRASSSFSNVGKAAQASTSRLGKFGDTAKRAGKIAAVGLGIGVIGATKDLIGMAKAAAEDEKSTALMAKQFRNSAHATREQIAATEKWITKVGIARGVADDELRPALANLVTATHDVSKAQKLTSLAMDIAAAKGKPLTAVSLALSKAYNGNVGALSRLGINTKDAAGKTLSFAAAQKRLSSEFGGASAAKAKTFSGIMDRFKVVLSETGEAIGYKLLPLLTKFGDWVLNKGFPAAQKFFDQFKAGEGTAGDLRKQLEGLYRAGKKVVEFFIAIPGPVKKFAVEGLIAYAVLSKLQAGFSAVGSSSAGQFVTGMRNAETRTMAVKNASVQLGGALKQLAGVGGMVAIAQGAREANTGLALLEATAGGAAAGFAAGGPIGAAIGAGAGATFILGKALFDSGEKAKAATPKFSDYASSLNEVTGASTRSTAALVKQDLATNHVLEKSNALGISERLLVRGVAGLGGAREKLIATLRNQAAAADAQYAADKRALEQEKIGGNLYRQKLAVLQEQRDRTKELTSAVLGQVGVVEKNRLAFLQNSVTLAKNGQELKSAKRQLDLYGKTRALAEVGITGKAKTLQDIKEIDRKANELARVRRMQFNAVFGVGSSPRPRAKGGPVKAGQPYVVGEHRPELFVPSQSGRIEPRVPSAAASTVSGGGDTYIINVSGVLDGRQAGIEIERVLSELKNTRGNRPLAFAS